MLQRSTVVLAAVLMLLVPTLPAFASDGDTVVEAPLYTVKNNDAHETEIAEVVEGGPGEKGRWLAPFEGEKPAVNLALLPGGQLLYFSGVEANESANGPTQLQFIWDATPLEARSRVLDLSELEIGDEEVTGVEDAISIPTPETGGEYDLFCSGTTITPGGEAVVPGATQYYTLDRDPPRNLYTPLKGWEQAVTFDPDRTGDEWQRTDDMDVPRWYPSALQLANGDTMVASGIRTLFMPNTYNTLVETYDPDQADTEDDRDDWQNMDTSFQAAPGVTVDDHELPNTPDTGIAFVDETHRGVPNLPMYPRMHVIPSGPHAGDVLYGANGDVWGPFGEHPLQPLWGHMQTLEMNEDGTEGTWTVHDQSPSSVRNLGATVPMMVDAEDPKPRYLSFGGTVHQSTVATPSAEIIDASGETITSSLTDPMTYPRWSVNGVLLPDGSVLSIGGSMYDNVVMHASPQVAPLNIERFVPGDGPLGGEWETLPPMDSGRAYHSTAVLLPDGRVAVGGHVPLPAFHHHQRTTGGNPQPTDTTFQLYEPSYLFHGDESRPEIQTTAGGFTDEANGEPVLPASFGDQVTLAVDGLDEGLDSVTLMRPGAATHQYNADQLGVELSITDTGLDADGQGSITVELPDDLAMAPGNYMLFVNEDVDGEIYPSKAAWLDISLP